MRFDRQAIPALFVAWLVLVGSATAFYAGVNYLSLHLQKESVPLRSPLATLPSGIGGWDRCSDDIILSEAMVEELGTNKYIDRAYAIDGEPVNGVLRVHLAYYTGIIDAVPHIPERCWAASGLSQTLPSSHYELELDTSNWNMDSGVINTDTGQEYPTVELEDPITGQVETVHMPIGSIKMRLTEFQDPAKPDLRMLGGYFFIANGRSASDAMSVRRAAFNMTDKYSYYCKVQISGTIEYDTNGRYRQSYLEQCEDLISELLPHIMRKLPDWPRLEAPEPSSDSTVSLWTEEQPIHPLLGT